MSNFHTELVRRVRLDGIPARQQGTCKHVLGWIAYHASEEEADIAYPGIETLELETGLRAKAIVTATETLAEHEWISKKRRLGTSNIYRINVRKLREHYVPKQPSKVAKLINELPGLGFSHEDEPGSDADPTPSDPKPETSENSYPQANDQHLCSHDMTGMSSEHSCDVVTTQQGCSHDTQTVREPAETHQPPPATESSAVPEEPGSSNAGWLGSSAEAQDEPQPDTAAGVTFLRSLVLPDGTKLADDVVTAEADRTSTLLASGWGKQELMATITDGSGIRVKSWTALVRSKLRKQQPKQQTTGSPVASAWPEWCGECEREDRRHMGEDGRLYRCPTCHPRSVQRQSPLKLVG